MSRSSSISTFWAYEAEIVDVKPNGNLIIASASLNDGREQEIPPLFFGGNDDSGLFMSPMIGDRVLCLRVHPGRSGVIQAIKLIPVRNKDVPSEDISNAPDVPAGYSSYPIRNLKPGDARLVSSGGGEVMLRGSPDNLDVFIGNSTRSGTYISSVGSDTTHTSISDAIQDISGGYKQYGGAVIRTPEVTSSKISSSRITHQLTAYDKPTDGIRRGVWPKYPSSNISINNVARNPGLSEYRMVINEFLETSKYRGFDLEADIAYDKKIQKFSTDKELRFLDPRNTLYLGPHQLIEVIAGNVISYRGDLLDINYGNIVTGIAGFPASQNIKLSYEEDRLVVRRGLGYHFQLSTNSKSESQVYSNNNFIFSLDKEGILKLNVPKSTRTGNIPYQTSARFYTSGGGIASYPLITTRDEKIPVTLRDDKNNVLFPKFSNVESDTFGVGSSDGGTGAVLRKTGVKFANENSYFKNFNPGDATAPVRVNFTKHHNMYAAAEMLIANTIKKINSPITNAEADHIVIGNPVGKPFELGLKNPEDDGSNLNDLTYMSTVSVFPGPPSVDPGGGTVVAGVSYLEENDAHGNYINIPFSNAFAIDEENGELIVTSRGNEPRKDPGGKSASINFDGAIDVSVGKDNYDQKSIVLDTAGSMIAWFGKDRNGRSIVAQTDGDVLLNIGGNNGEVFNKGRIDLRVNVTNKGFVGEKTIESAPGKKSEKPEGGAAASDYIISISDEGIVIAGMNPSAPMIIRNDGDLIIESTANLILAGNKIDIRDGNKPAKDPSKSDVSMDTPSASLAEGPAKIESIKKQLSK